MTLTNFKNKMPRHKINAEQLLETIETAKERLKTRHKDNWYGD